MLRGKFSANAFICFAGALLLFMNFAIIPFSSVLALINICITLVILVACFAVAYSFKSANLKIAESTLNFLNSNACNIVKNIPMPAIIVSANDEHKFLFYSNEFKEMFLDDENLDFDVLHNIICGNTIKQVLNGKSVNINWNDNSYEVNGYKKDEYLVIYFKDNTLYKDMKQKYASSRMCFMHVLFDNKDELRQTLSDEQALYVALNVENTLQKWILSSKGMFEKLSDGKYLAIVTEDCLQEFIDNKFKILDDIRAIKVAENKYATVSIGVCRGGSSPEISDQIAKNALDMALGRGGDQVAIKNRTSYEFFGGNSQSLEKRSKVRTRMVAKSIIEKAKTADIVFIMGHKFSDFDSVGASVGLWSVLTRVHNKKCYIVLDKSETLAKPLLHNIPASDIGKMFVSPKQAQAMATEDSFLIIVDTHSVKFLQDVDLYRMIKNVAVIDHHIMTVDKINNACIFFNEPSASSACEMVTEMVQYMGDKCLTVPEAESLMAGMMLDTKNFSLKTGVRTFEAAAYLKKIGANSAKIKKMFANSMDLYKLRCKIIDNAEIFNNCIISFFRPEGENPRIYCAQAADDLLEIENIKASFVMFELDGVVNVSARSHSDINVQLIMEKFGGGGHHTMAAAQIKDMSLYEVKQKLIQSIDERTNKIKNKNGE